MNTGTAAILSQRWRIDAAVRSDVGLERLENEDRIAFFEPDDPALLAAKGALAVMADGMGGHSAGAVASEMAVDLVRRSYYEQRGAVPAALAFAFAKANAEIHQRSDAEPTYHGMGTTCTALVLVDRFAYCAHVGDSRLYLIREGGVRLMSEDHSVVREMVKAGIISIDEANHHPQRNLISRALGARGTVDVFAWPNPLELRSGDLFVLCSDGLYDLVDDEEIRQVCTAEQPPAACDRLIAIAKSRGGHDNITVGVLGVTSHR